MSHSAGLSGWREPITDRGPLRLGEGTAPACRPGAVLEARHGPGYHAVTQGYLVGEVVRRDHRPVARARSSARRSPSRSAPTSTSDCRQSEDARVAELIPPPRAPACRRRRPSCRSTVRQPAARRCRRPDPRRGAPPRSRPAAAPATPARSPRSTPSWPTAAWPAAGASCPRPACAGRSSRRSKGPTWFSASRPLRARLRDRRGTHAQPQHHLLGRLRRFAARSSTWTRTSTFGYVMNKMAGTTMGDTRAYGMAAAVWRATATRAAKLG